jgi:hypothetical protein
MPGMFQTELMVKFEQYLSIQFAEIVNIADNLLVQYFLRPLFALLITIHKKSDCLQKVQYFH